MGLCYVLNVKCFIVPLFVLCSLRRLLLDVNVVLCSPCALRSSFSGRVRFAPRFCFVSFFDFPASFPFIFASHFAFPSVCA